MFSDRVFESRSTGKSRSTLLNCSYRGRKHFDSEPLVNAYQSTRCRSPQALFLPQLHCEISQTLGCIQVRSLAFAKTTLHHGIRNYSGTSQTPGGPLFPQNHPISSPVHCGNAVAVLRSAILTVSCTAKSPGFAFQGGLVLKISQV